MSQQRAQFSVSQSYSEIHTCTKKENAKCGKNLYCCQLFGVKLNVIRKNMFSRKYTWYKIGNRIEELEFGENQIAVVEIEKRKLCIGKFQDKLFAFAYHCPHAGGVLSGGNIDKHGNVVCPLHGYQFRLKNGYNISGEGFQLKNWPVEERQDGIYVGIEDGSGFFGWGTT
jgi:nitrite reductase/ring-hydroxylating ferredoxin subunit